jgi:hypothetical protein
VNPVANRALLCVLLIAMGFGWSSSNSSAMDCSGFVRLPLVEPAVATLGLKQAVARGHISTEDAILKPIIALTKGFVDQKKRLVTLSFLTGFSGSDPHNQSPQYDRVLLYKYDVGDDWKDKQTLDIFGGGYSGALVQYPPINEQIEHGATEWVSLNCYEPEH